MNESERKKVRKGNKERKKGERKFYMSLSFV